MTCWGLGIGLRPIRRPLSDAERDVVAAAVEHLQLANWVIEKVSR
jgi:hypothetical protein